MQQPQESWSLDKLLEYGRSAIDQLHHSKVRMATETFKLGHAMTLAKPKVGGRKWAAWQTENGLPRTTVHQAMRLFNHFKGDEASLDGLTIMEAKKAAGILKTATTPKKATFIPTNSPKTLLRLDRAVASVVKAMEDITNDDEKLEAFKDLVDELNKVISNLNVINVPPPKRKQAAAHA